MPDSLYYIASLDKISSKFDHISVGYVQKTAQKQPKIVPSAENKSDINETWPRYVPAKYLKYNKNEGFNEWAVVGGWRNQESTRKCHEIKRNLTWT